MTRAARHDPLWALTAVILSPFRAGKYLIGVVLVTGIVGIVLFLGANLFADAIGFRKNSLEHTLLVLPAVIITLSLLVRMLTTPLILHFGDLEGETHGSARFANDKEIRPLTRQHSGLLIGRDAKAGKLLRYDGPAHLLTIAP